jgi:nicotinamidase-related amidase
MTDYDFRTDPEGPHGIDVDSWLEPERVALMVIDIQNYITLPQYSGVWTAGGGDTYYYPRLSEVVLPNLRRLIDSFRTLRRPVVYTRIAATNANLLDVPGLARKVLAEETRDIHGKLYHLHVDERASQIDNRITPKERDIVICKTASGAFCSADTDSILRNNGISRLVFCGGLTDACVASSVREAYDRGYLCMVAEDACISASEEDHDAALRSLRKFYAWVTSTAEIITALQRR